MVHQTHASKRPPDLAIRDQTPSKRRRPERPVIETKQIRVTTAKAPAISSPPSSRRNSLTHADSNVVSTTTPVAPLVPGMLPLKKTGPTNSPIGDASLTMASLRNLKLRKETLHMQSKPSSSFLDSLMQTSDLSMIQKQLADQHSEIVQLKKEREDILSQLKDCKTIHERVKSVEQQLNQHDKHQISSNSFFNTDKAPGVTSLVHECIQHELSNMNIEQQLNKYTPTDGLAILIEREVASQVEKMQKKLGDQALFATTVETNEAIHKNDFDKLSSRYDQLQARVEALESKEDRNWNVTVDIKRNSETLQDDIHGVFRDIRNYIGPIKSEFERTNTPLINRINRNFTDLFRVSKENSSTVNKCLESISNVTKVVEKFPLDVAKLSHDVKQIESVQSEQFGSTNLLNSSTLTARDINAKIDEISATVQRMGSKLTTLNIDQRIAAVDHKCGELNQIIKSGALHASNSSAHPIMSPDYSNRLACLETWKQDIDQTIEDIDKALQGVEEKQNIHTNSIEVLEAKPSELFREKFEPLQRTVNVLENLYQEERKAPNMQTLNVEVFTENLAELKTQLSSKADATDLLRLQEHMVSGFQQCHDDVQPFKQKIYNAIENVKANNENLAATNMAMRHLQTRYDNLTSDQLVQKMAQWFLQSYDSIPVELVRTCNELKKGFKKLQDQVNSHGPLFERSGELFNLLHVASRMDEIVNRPQTDTVASENSQKQIATRDKAEENACMARVTLARMLKQGEEVATLKNGVASLNRNLSRVEEELKAQNDRIRASGELSITAVNELRSEVQGMSETLTKTDLAAIQTSVKSLTEHLRSNLGLKDMVEEIKQQVQNYSRDTLSQAALEHDQRVKVELEQNESISELQKGLEKITGSSDMASFEDNMTFARQRADLNELIDLITPYKDYIPLVPRMICVVRDVQRWVEHLHQHPEKKFSKNDWKYVLDDSSDSPADRGQPSGSMS